MSCQQRDDIAPYRRSSGGIVDGPTERSSHADIGAASVHTLRTLDAARFVCSQDAGGQDRDIIRPLRRRSSMRGWSFA